MTLLELEPGVWVDPKEISVIHKNDEGLLRVVVGGQRVVVESLTISQLLDKLRHYINLEAL